MGVSRTLYLCYFGLREPLVQNQVLPYLRQLVFAGVRVSLLTFEPQLQEKWNEQELAAEKARLGAEGINWLYLPYHKRPSLPATIYDVLAGARMAVRLARRDGVNVLHARAHVAMAMALLARPFVGCRLIFDIRGLIADEYVDAGVWKEGSPPFRIVKWVERAGLRLADQVVVLTERMRDYLVARGAVSAEKIEVIPCCVDFSRFENSPNGSQAAERFEIVYAGSVTGLYMLEEMGRFFLTLQAQRSDALFRVLTISSAEDAAERLRRVGLKEQDFQIGSVRPADVPIYLRRAQLGLSFRTPTFSQLAASPTKIAEYLAAGLPAVCNAGIGDMDDLLEKENVGVVVKTFDEEAYREAATKALALTSVEAISQRCLKAARLHFDLTTIGGNRYRNVYRRIEEQLKAANP